jgi:hypothetical protein
MTCNDTIKKIFEAKKVQTISIGMVLKIMERHYFFLQFLDFNNTYSLIFL